MGSSQRGTSAKLASPLPASRAPTARRVRLPLRRSPSSARRTSPVPQRRSPAAPPACAAYIMLVSLSATLSVPASEMLFTNTTFWMP